VNSSAITARHPDVPNFSGLLFTFFATERAMARYCILAPAALHGAGRLRQERVTTPLQRISI
jgi:hypothetical protein